LLLFTAISIFGSNTNDTVNINVNQGVLDISDWNFKQNGIITLNGQWEFYWNQLLDPNYFHTSKNKKYIKLPGVWNRYLYDNECLLGKGFATFRIRIKNKIKNEKLGLRVHFHFTAYKLWINNNLLAQNGNVGKTKETSIPQTVPQYVYFYAPNKDILLTLQVGNFHFDKGGAPASYKF
jgi:hypothetical protein